MVFGIFFCTLFVCVNDQSWATEKKTTTEQIKWERTSDLIINASFKNCPPRSTPACIVPWSWPATNYTLTGVEVKKGTLPDQKIYMDVTNHMDGTNSFGKLETVLLEKKVLKLYFIKQTKGYVSGFTDSQGVFWQLVFWEQVVSPS